MALVKLDDLEDLLDLAMFAAIVENGGINAASRQLAIPKSRLSRHLAGLEQRYNIQLFHRSTKHFVTTDFGQALYARCVLLLGHAQDAQVLMASAQAIPHGVLRVSAPAPLANFWLAPILPKFLALHPALRLELESRDREVDLIADRIDLAIQIRRTPLSDSDLVIRHLGTSHQILVAAPSLLAGHPPVAHPADLAKLPLMGFNAAQGTIEWQLTSIGGETFKLSFRARLATFELVLLRQASIEGAGVAMLPSHFCRSALDNGELAAVLPDWCGPLNDIHVAFLSRRGLSSGARALIDFLARHLPKGDEA